MLKITLKDKSIIEVENGSTAYDVAKLISEGLARKALGALIDGEVCELTKQISIRGCSLDYIRTIKKNQYTWLEIPVTYRRLRRIDVPGIEPPSNNFADKVPSCAKLSILTDTPMLTIVISNKTAILLGLLIISEVSTRSKEIPDGGGSERSPPSGTSHSLTEVTRTISIIN